MALILPSGECQFGGHGSLWADVRNNACDDIGLLQFLESWYKDNVLLPAASGPSLDHLAWRILGDRDPNKTRRLPKNSGCHSSFPKTERPPISEHNHIRPGILAAKTEFCLRSEQGQRGERTSPRPCQTSDKLFHLCQIACEMSNCLDGADLLPIYLLCVPCKALEHATPRPGPTIQDHGHVGLRALHIESVHKHLRRFDLCRPARFAKTSTAIKEQHDIKLLVTSHREIACRELAPLHIALLVLQPFQRPRTWTLTSALRNCLDELLAFCSAPITVFGACTPLSPCCEPTILLACLVVASSCL